MPKLKRSERLIDFIYTSIKTINLFYLNIPAKIANGLKTETPDKHDSCTVSKIIFIVNL